VRDCASIFSFCTRVSYILAKRQLAPHRTWNICTNPPCFSPMRQASPPDWCFLSLRVLPQNTLGQLSTVFLNCVRVHHSVPTVFLSSPFDSLAQGQHVCTIYICLSSFSLYTTIVPLVHCCFQYVCVFRRLSWNIVSLRVETTVEATTGNHFICCIVWRSLVTVVVIHVSFTLG